MNALKSASSPYLRKHAGEAVAWQPWGERAFALSLAEDKPIFISIGYLACHWCHVMAQESFSDPGIVALINRHFVAIKVDREEHPDVDRSVLDAMARLKARTGWPVSAFMTPQGDVFAGGSYYPPVPRYGLPGFRDVLEAAAADYRRLSTSPDAVGETVAAVTPRDEGSAVADIARYALFLGDRLLENIDPVYGGFGMSGPRFANVAAHQMLWHRYVLTGSEPFKQAAVDSLSCICRSALVDPIGGGVHRYCADDAWEVPHFEKMLYDNAQILELLTWVWRETRSPVLRTCAEGIVAWSLKEMAIPGSGFASSLSADAPRSGFEKSAGDGCDDEGAFYRWDETGIAADLGNEAAFFLDHFAICPIGAEDSGPLKRIERRGAAGAEEEGRLAACLKVLSERRLLRARPTRDDKVMADWNGLMLVALLEAGSAFERRDWLAFTRQAFDALVDRLMPDGTLHHCILDDTMGPAAYLDDYAMMSRAALRLFEAFGKQRYLDHAEAWVAILDAEFWEPDKGGYCMSSARHWHPGSLAGSRVRTITETSLPSGNAAMIGVLARLYALTGTDAYRQRADRLIAAFHTDIVRSSIAAASAVDNVQTFAQFVSIKVSGPPDNATTKALLRVALDYSLPDRMVLGPGSGAGLAPDAIPTAQVCIGTSCLAPMVSVEALRRFTAPGSLAVAV